MSDGTPPSSYWEPPEPSADDVYEEATWLADLFVAEWADLTEMELFIDVTVNRGNEPVFTLDLVQKDGIEIARPAEEFDSIDAVREWVSARWPVDGKEEE